ncbi:MAG: hypothetical protein JWM11_660, partial [Planctomycetaceae bacterium]|nr:hypothetical protein [Planctomycetaceae bacterium]
MKAEGDLFVMESVDLSQDLPIAKNVQIGISRDQRYALIACNEPRWGSDSIPGMLPPWATDMPKGRRPSTFIEIAPKTDVNPLPTSNVIPESAPAPAPPTSDVAPATEPAPKPAPPPVAPPPAAAVRLHERMMMSLVELGARLAQRSHSNPAVEHNVRDISHEMEVNAPRRVVVSDRDVATQQSGGSLGLLPQSFSLDQTTKHIELASATVNGFEWLSLLLNAEPVDVERPRKTGPPATRGTEEHDGVKADAQVKVNGSGVDVKEKGIEQPISAGLAGPSQTVFLYALDLKTLQRVALDSDAIVPTLRMGKLLGMNVSATTDHVVLTGSSGHVLLYQWTKPEIEMVGSWNSNQGDNTSVAFSPDGKRLVVANLRGGVAAWRLDGLEFSQYLRSGNPEWTKCSVNPKDSVFAITTWNRPLEVRNADSGDKLGTCDQAFVRELQWTHEGTRLLMITPQDHEAKVLSPFRYLRIANWTKRETADSVVISASEAVDVGFPVLTLAVSPDDATVVIGGRNGGIVVGTLKGSTWTRDRVLGDQGLTILKLIFDPTGKMLAASTYTGTIQVWSTETWKLLREFSATDVSSITDRNNSVTSSKAPLANAITFGADSQSLLAGFASREVVLWRWTNGIESATATQLLHDAFTSGNDLKVDGTARDWQTESTWLAAAASPDGKYLALGNQSGTIVVLNRDGQLLARWLGHTTGTHQLTFGPQQDQLVSNGFSGQLRRWQLDRLGTSLRELGFAWNPSEPLPPQPRPAPVPVVPKPSIKGPRLAEAPDRRAAEWVIQLGGIAAVRFLDGRESSHSPKNALPAEEFDLIAIDLWGKSTTSDDGLQNLEGLKRLNRYGNNGGGFGAAGMAVLGSISSLRDMDLHGVAVTDEGLGHLANMPYLSSLILSGTKVSDRGMKSLSKIPRLVEVGLDSTPLTDAGIESLRTMKSLKRIGLRGTKVTQAGIEKLSLALTQCRIEWDGGVVEPQDTKAVPTPSPVAPASVAPASVAPAPAVPAPVIPAPLAAFPDQPAVAPAQVTSKSVKEQIFEVKTSGKLDGKRVRGPLVITESNITVDGDGLILTGNEGNPKAFKGVAISAKGVSNVTLKNFKARGWETGLKLVDCDGWTIENCNFSDNFHDPEFGWGENGRRGGIVFERVRKTTLRKNKANNVWDACVLLDSDENTLEDNDFSHTSNTCLKLWHASKNVIRKNVLSHGIRISPGEVHARDSTSVLVESGSNDNRFIENDCTHGGDGIFVRVLNGWCSTGNLFEKNDCSYANNNGFECWARDNVFRNNKANHCSYGFWLGGSDHTVLEGNEASFNGLADGHHNSPHLPDAGHAGIVFMFGPSSHTVARRNTCIGNNGAGLAVIGDLDSQGKKWKAYHWIIENNTLSRNRWGVYIQFADWIDIRANRFDSQNAGGNDNAIADVQAEAGVTRLVVDQRPLPDKAADGKELSVPRPYIEGPTSARVGEEVHFVATSADEFEGQPEFTWDMGDGTRIKTASVNYVFIKPGFYRVGLSVSNAAGANLAWRDFYVVDKREEIGTEGQAAEWSIEDFHERTRSDQQTSQAEFTDDPVERLVGKSATRVVIRPYAGFRAALTYPKTRDAEWSLEGKTKLVFWIKAINEDVTGWQGGPFIVLHGDGDQRCYLEPKPGLDLMRQLDYNEGRDGWRLMEIPLKG